MRILFVGGTGNLSTACTAEALGRGMEVFHLNRGTQPEKTLPGVRTLKADIRDPAAARAALGSLEFDSVVQFLAFRPEQVEADLELFRGRTGQYVLISTASAYKKPSLTPVITEETPLENPYWEYSRLKAACEKVLKEKAAALFFPWTVVRPSHTYDDGWIPSCFGSAGFGIAWRMKEGKPIVVPGDGQSIWTLTHASDFAVGLVGLLGRKDALSEAFHITSDEHLTWDAIHRIVGGALGVEPRIVHIPSDFIASLIPERGAALLGDKAVSVLFDNAKIRRFVPEFSPRVPFAEGIRRSLGWFDAHPELERPDDRIDQEMEAILGRWRQLADYRGGLTATD
jgi:nucleoside-diphosphate-sugar epimerase